MNTKPVTSEDLDRMEAGDEPRIEARIPLDAHGYVTPRMYDKKRPRLSTDDDIILAYQMQAYVLRKLMRDGPITRVVVTPDEQAQLRMVKVEIDEDESGRIFATLDMDS